MTIWKKGRNKKTKTLHFNDIKTDRVQMRSLRMLSVKSTERYKQQKTQRKSLRLLQTGIKSDCDVSLCFDKQTITWIEIEKKYTRELNVMTEWIQQQKSVIVRCHGAATGLPLYVPQLKNTFIHSEMRAITLNDSNDIRSFGVQ